MNNTEETEDNNSQDQHQTSGKSATVHSPEHLDESTPVADIKNNEIKDMEVHHHPHVEKKNFKEYVLEGLMIFLAVSMGFVAENIRERISDKSKEHEYVANIKKDLAADTVALNIWIPSLINKINQFDSLIAILQIPDNTAKGSDMYYYARLSTRTRLFDANINTITELKNSGNFRLINSQKVVDGITRFQKNIDNYLTLGAVDVKESELLYPMLSTLFDASVFNTMMHFRAEDASISSDSLGAAGVLNLSRPAGNPQLRSHNPDNINSFIFYLHQRKSSFLGETRFLQDQKKLATDLIDEINKEYHLDNE